MNDTGGLVNIRDSTDDIEIDYKQMPTVVTTCLNDNESFKLTSAGMKIVRYNRACYMYRLSLLYLQLSLLSISEHLFILVSSASEKNMPGRLLQIPIIDEDKGKRKKWLPPKFKVNPKDLNEIPDDPEVTESIIGSEEQDYYLSFLPQTEKEISVEDNKTTDRLLPVGPSSLDEEEDLIPEPQLPVENLSQAERIEKLSKQLLIAYKKNGTLARKNKSLRLQFYAACKKTLSQKAKMEVAKDVLKPFFTPTQIDCFCRPSWLRSRNWAEEDFQIALSLRKLMSKKAFGYLRKKRMVPMPSLTSLRKYNKSKGIVIQHNTMRVSSSRKGGKSSKKVKNQAPTRASNSTGLQNVDESKEGSKQSPLLQHENIRLISKQEPVTQQQPLLISSTGDFGNVEFLQQTVDQTGQVITTALPMMTTTDGTTVVQVISISIILIIRPSWLAASSHF